MHNDNHQDLLANLAAEFKEIMENSNQAIYLYLDDANKVCNKNFATLLGYDSPEEWAAVKEPFPIAFVVVNSQNDLINAFQSAITKNISSKLEITWKKKDGGEVDSSVILVPISFQRHVIALHYIDKP